MRVHSEQELIQFILVCRPATAKIVWKIDQSIVVVVEAIVAVRALRWIRTAGAVGILWVVNQLVPVVIEAVVANKEQRFLGRIARALTTRILGVGRKPVAVAINDVVAHAGAPFRRVKQAVTAKISGIIGEPVAVIIEAVFAKLVAALRCVVAGLRRQAKCCPLEATSDGITCTGVAGLETRAEALVVAKAVGRSIDA